MITKYERMRLKNLPLRVVLVVPFVLELIAAIGVAAFLSYQYRMEAVNDLATRLTSNVSARVADYLNSYLTTATQTTNNTVMAIELGWLDWQNSANLQRYFKSQLQNLDSTPHSLSLMLLVDQQRNLFGIEKKNRLEWFVHRRNVQTRYRLRSQLIEVDGQPSPYEVQFDLRQDPFDEKSWYPLAQQHQQGAWQLVPISDREYPSLSAAYLRPFHHAKQMTQGVVGTFINLADINDHLVALDFSPQGQVFIVDRTGAFVASSSHDPLFAGSRKSRDRDLSSNLVSNPRQRSRLLANRSANEVTRTAAQFLLNQFGQFSAITQQQQFYFNHDQQDYFLQVTPLKQPRSLNWFLVVVIPKSHVLSQFDRQDHTMYALLGVAIVSAIALGLATAQHIIRPIQRLSRASQDLMLGKLEVPVKEQSRIAELAVLAHSFNEMTKHLMQSFDQVKLALQESKEKFTTVFRTSPDPMLLTTFPDGKILEINDSFLRIVECTHEQVIGYTTTKLGLWSNLSDRAVMMQTLQETGRVQNYEVTTEIRGKLLTFLLSCELIELEGKPCLITVCKDIGDRKHLEEALRKSEAKLQDVLNSVSAAICYFHLNQPGVPEPDYLSAGSEVVFGYPVDVMLIDRSLWQSRVHPEDLQTVIRPALEQVMQGRSLTIAYRYLHPETGWRWISADVMTHWDDQQNCRLMTTVETDITDRKQTEAALRMSEELFRTAFETGGIGMDITDLEGQIIRCNPTVCQMLGYSESELLQRTYRDVTHPDDLPLDYAANHQILTGDVFNLTYEKRFIHKDGQTIWTILSLALIRDLQHQPLYWVAQLQDITARKQTEQALQQSEVRFRAVFETAEIGIAIADLEGKISEANDALCRICGYPRVELQQMKLQQIIHPNDLHRWSRLVQELHTLWLDQYQLKVNCIRKDGGITSVQLNTLFIRDATRTPLYFVARITALPDAFSISQGDFVPWRSS